MKFLIETLSGRKGIKNFESTNEYIDYMTKYGDQIKTLVESELPYNDKPVKMVKVSGSKGWEELDGSAFGDIASDGEKGESVMSGSNSESIVKDDAEFSWTEPSEKEDKHEEPKVENSDYMPKEQKQEAPKSSTPKEEKSENNDKEEKSENNDKEDKKEDKKEDIKEAVEVQPDMFGGEDEVYNDGVKSYTFHDIYDYMEKNFPQMDFVGSDEQGSKTILKYMPSGADNKIIRDVKKQVEADLEGVKVLLARSQYAPEIRSMMIVYEDKAVLSDELDEGFKDGLKKAGKYVAGAALGAGMMANANASNYDPMYDGATRPFEDETQLSALYDGPHAKEIKSVNIDGSVTDIYGNDWSYEDWQKIQDGIDPFGEGIANSDEIDESINDILKNAGIN